MFDFKLKVALLIIIAALGMALLLKIPFNDLLSIPLFYHLSNIFHMYNRVQ